MRTWLARGLCATLVAAGLTLTSGVPARAATEVGRINLEASTTSRQLKALPEFSLRSGKVAVKVLTSGKPVRIDALAVSRM